MLASCLGQTDRVEKMSLGVRSSTKLLGTDKNLKNNNRRLLFFYRGYSIIYFFDDERNRQHCNSIEGIISSLTHIIRYIETCLNDCLVPQTVTNHH